MKKVELKEINISLDSKCCWLFEDEKVKLRMNDTSSAGAKSAAREQARHFLRRARVGEGDVAASHRDDVYNTILSIFLNFFLSFLGE